MKAIMIAICFLLAAIGSYYGEPYVGDNSDAILILVTVFTVFAGFLVAIITILGDPSLIPQGSWRLAEGRREIIHNRLITHIALFVLYLIAIGLLFAGVIIKKAPSEHVSLSVKEWIDRAYLFFGIASFLFTFGLPISLMRFQSDRVDAEIERRRKEEGISDA